MRKTDLQITRLLGPAILVCALLPAPAHGQCEVAQLVGSNGLGFVATDGDIAVVGDTGAFQSLGAVYVFRRGPGGPDDWTAEATLVSPNQSSSDQYGRAIAISGEVIVVGAAATNDPEFHIGAAYVYRFDAMTEQWEFETTLQASDGDFGDIFGRSVAIEGDVIVVGARDDENDGILLSGSAYVFRYDPKSKHWIEEDKLVDPNAEEIDLLGATISVSGEVVLIGAPGNQDAGSGTGAAFTFRHDPNNLGKWNLEQQLQAFDAKGGADFGFSVSIQGDVALIGARFDDGQTGAAYVMRFDGMQWVHEAKLVATNPVGPFPLMGTGVSLSDDGTTAIAGAPLDNEAGNQAGAAHLFRKENGKWTEIAKLFASDAGPGQDFGESLALNGDIALIKGGDVGAAKGYIFAGIKGIDCNHNGQPDACDIFDGQSNDQNNNGIPDECEHLECPWDLDNNGSVGTTDLLELFVQWGTDGPADFDGNGAVATADLLILLANWGLCK